jgi:hypothetical protein
MINLPETTNVYRQMPKELFYKYFNDNSSSKKTFLDEIKSIIWINTLSPETMFVKNGQHITEIAVVEITLNRQAISADIIETVNRGINQYAIFIIRYEEWKQLWCCDRKSINPKTGHFNCKNYCQTSWLFADDLKLKVEGENLDQVYENFLMQIAGKPFPVSIDRNQKDTEELIKNTEPVGKYKQLEILQVAIKTLEDQMGKVKQFDKQVKLATELKNAQDEIKKIKQSMSTHIEVQPPSSVAEQEETAEKIRAFFPNVYFKMQNGSGNRFDYSFL